MKRCPQCNRVEAEDTLTFCRVDGTPLVRESAAVSDSAGTLKLSPPRAADAETRVLPSDDGADRPTAPTTVLNARPAPGGTGELGEPKSRKKVRVAVAAIAAVALAIAATAYYHLSRGKEDKVINSIAVLPFVNEGGSGDAEYLSDGMAESLISSLSRIPQLSVKARSSVFRYKGKEADLQKVARELNVQAILNGRVMQRGEQLILNLELADGRTENVIWSERYDRKQADIVSLQIKPLCTESA